MHLGPTVHWSALLNRKSEKLRTLMPGWPQVATVATNNPLKYNLGTGQTVKEI